MSQAGNQRSSNAGGTPPGTASSPLDAAHIYVQIPAYRDRELLGTVRDLTKTAMNADRLRIAIAWQYGHDEAHLGDKLRGCGGVELIKIPAERSRGCNWARNILQSGWNGEEYTLFLDSHHRFAQNWDQKVIEMFEGLRRAGSSKPILTGYLPAYDPHDDPQGRTQSLLRIHLRERHQDMLFRLVGHEIPNWRQLTSPVPAHFASLHFLFADGTFNRDLAFDPSIYFFADEVAIALRAFTRGYDLFHPHRILGWHLYDRATRVTHWEDHADWREHEEVSCQTLYELYDNRLIGKYGIGEVRTIADYERFIGMPLIANRS
jgi:UDP-N-acetylglucosamine (GlcNAc):hydroxyproline polypeptide GlcNAc-transferase